MKENTMRKWKVALGVTAGFCLCSAVAMIGAPVTAYAENTVATVKEYEGFEMSKGAEVRVAEDGVGGIRFTTNVSSAAYDAIEADYEGYKSISFYTLFARADKMESLDSLEELTVDKVHDEAYSDYVLRTKATVQPDGETVTSYKITYTTEDAANYSKVLMARGVAEIVDADGVTHYVYAKANDNVRTMQQIALAEITDETVDSDEGLEKYFSAKTATDKLFVETAEKEAALDLAISDTAEGESVVAAFTNAGEKLPVDLTSGAKLSDLTKVTSALGGETSVKLYTDKNNVFTATVKTVSKVIKTEKEFLKLYDYLTITDDTTNQLLTMDGYIALGANLDFSSMAVSDYYQNQYNTADTRRGFSWVSYYNNEAMDTATRKAYAQVAFSSTASSIVGTDHKLTSKGELAKSKGFIGTLDGQGYTVKGLRIGACGIFPFVGTNGVIKNIAFADTVLSYECFPFGGLFAGTLDNSLIDVKEMVSGAWGVGGVARVFTGTINNTIINVLNLDATDGNSGAIAFRSLGGSAWGKTYVLTDTMKYYGNGTNSSYTGSLFTSVEAFNAGTKDYTNYDKNIWDFESYELPVFKTYTGTNIAKKA